MHMYQQLVTDSDGDDAWWREGEEGDWCGERKGRVRSPAKFPTEQFTVMGEYTVTVKFSPCGCVFVGVGGMLSDSREHLSCLEFSFLLPPTL